MRIAEGYILKEIAGNFIVIPVGQNIVDYKSMLHLNETGALIWKQLESDSTYEQLIACLTTEYEATGDEKIIMESDLVEFINQMKTMNLLILE